MRPIDEVIETGLLSPSDLELREVMAIASAAQLAREKVQRLEKRNRRDDWGERLGRAKWIAGAIVVAAFVIGLGQVAARSCEVEYEIKERDLVQQAGMVCDEWRDGNTYSDNVRYMCVEQGMQCRKGADCDD